ncbi:MAG: hypothetical protein HKN07_06420 [Acidimicrobiia bacterium]|nr:hypothetical protein [Acidimicrobiia bacterium]NNF63876.1 hypothetical protein [Acidimicrobiia bacterium]
MSLRLAFAALLVISACTSSAPPDPARVDTCDDLVSAATKLVEQYLDAVQGQPLEILTGEAPPTERIVELDAVSTGFDRRVAELNCDPAEINAGVVANLGDVVPTDPAGELLLDIVRGGATVPTPTVPPTDDATSTDG